MWSIVYFCFIIFSGVFFWSFNWDKFPCLLILLIFLCLYETRWKNSIWWSWRRSLIWSIPVQSACPQFLWWESWIDINTNHIFPQSVLADITFIVGWAGNGGDRARARCQAGHPLCSVAINTLSGVGSDLKLLQQNLWCLSLSWLSSL